VSNRRRSKRRPSLLPLAAAAAVLVIGGGALALSGHGGGKQPTGSANTAAGDAAATTSVTTGAATDGPAPSGTHSGSAAASASASAGASAKTSAGASSSTSSTSSAPGATQGTTTTASGGSAGLPATRVFTGLAFDTCTAPGLSTMNAWHSASPYGAAAVYIGGANRGCAQPQLTAAWVASVHASGWQLIPLYVGAQPPCQTSGNPERISATNAASLGASDGSDAARRAAALGMHRGSALYLDMEAYDTTNKSCVQAVQTYVQAWDRAAHAAGYWAGFYGFSKSSANAIASAAAAGTADLPDALWYARYDGNADTTTGFPWSASLWSGHRRGHQYAVNLHETYRGSALTVDRDAWNGPVAVIG
jgi:hypothetical protein